MNFVTVKFELNDGNVASTLISEDKVDVVLEGLRSKTNAWISTD